MGTDNQEGRYALFFIEEVKYHVNKMHEENMNQLRELQRKVEDLVQLVNNLNSKDQSTKVESVKKTNYKKRV